MKTTTAITTRNPTQEPKPPPPLNAHRSTMSVLPSTLPFSSRASTMTYRTRPLPRSLLGRSISGQQQEGRVWRPFSTTMRESQRRVPSARYSVQVPCQPKPSKTWGSEFCVRMFVSFDDSGGQGCVGTDALLRICQFEDEAPSWTWWDAIVEEVKERWSGVQSERHVPNDVACTTVDIIAEVIFLDAVDVIPIIRMIDREAIGIHFGVGFVKFVMLGGSPLKNEFLGSNIELLEQTIPDVDSVSYSEHAWVVERVDLVEGNKSGAFRSDGQLVEIGTKIVDTSDASYLFILGVEDVEIAFSMSTNSIIADPVCQDLFSLVLLNFEVVGLSFDQMRPDEVAMVVEDGDRRIRNSEASRRQENVVVVVTQGRVDGLSHGRRSSCVYTRRVVTGTDIVGDSKKASVGSFEMTKNKGR
ncbi:hypothetical protein KCU91_g27, partial [Aureobasidium melanogenum]